LIKAPCRTQSERRAKGAWWAGVFGQLHTDKADSAITGCSQHLVAAGVTMLGLGAGERVLDARLSWNEMQLPATWFRHSVAQTAAGNGARAARPWCPGGAWTQTPRIHSQQ